MKRIAVFEVEFDDEDMIDKESLKEYWQNDLLKYMQEVYENEGIGIFDKPLKLVELKEENKILEKLKLSSHWFGTLEQEQKYRNKRDDEIAFKINEIIDYLKSKGE